LAFSPISDIVFNFNYIIKMKKVKILGTGILLIVIVINAKLMLTKELKGDFLSEEFEEIAYYIAVKDSFNKNVSEVPISWHLDHMLITITEIYKVMDTSKVTNYKHKPNFARAMMFTFNKIPRGGAQSPDQVRPPEVSTADTILLHLTQAKLSLTALNSLPEKAYFEHPYIGSLRRKHAKKFLKIHTEHHLKIIRDIVKEKD